MIHQPQVGHFICILFNHSHCPVDWVKDASERDIVWWKGDDVAVKTMVMKEIHGVIEGSSEMECGRDNMVSAGLEGI